MRTETWLWAAVSAYFVIIAAIYGGVGGSAAGVVVLIAAAAFGGLVAGWSWHWSRGHLARPSDLDTADASDDIGDSGEFALASLRPLGIGAGMTLTLIGVPLGSWLVLIGVALLGSQIGLIVHDRDA